MYAIHTISYECICVGHAFFVRYATNRNQFEYRGKEKKAECMGKFVSSILIW